MIKSARADDEKFFVGKRHIFAWNTFVFQENVTHFRRKIAVKCRRRIYSAFTQEAEQVCDKMPPQRIYAKG